MEKNIVIDEQSFLGYQENNCWMKSDFLVTAYFLPRGTEAFKKTIILEVPGTHSDVTSLL